MSDWKRPGEILAPLAKHAVLDDLDLRENYLRWVDRWAYGHGVIDKFGPRHERVSVNFRRAELEMELLP